MNRSSLNWVLIASSSILQLSCGTGIDPNSAYIASGGSTTDSASCTQALSSSWTGIKQLGVATKAVYPERAAFDRSGPYLYVTGDTTGGLEGSGATGTGDYFVIKYNLAGERVWVRQAGIATKNTGGEAVAFDASGNVYIAGFTQGNLGGTLVGTQDIIVVKYDSSGTLQWTRQLGAAGAVTASYGIAYDQTTDSVIVTGTTLGALDGTSLGTSTQNLFVTKYNASGVKQWTKAFGNGGNNSGTAILTDSSGNIYIAGHAGAAIGGNTQTGTRDMLLLKLDSTGTLVWAKQLGAAGKETTSSALTRDSSGNLYILGTTTGSLPTTTQVGTFDTFLVKYDSSGARQWIKQLGVVSKSTSPGNVVVDSSSNVMISGSVLGTIEGLTPTGTGDAMIAKYDSSGNRQWIKLLGVASGSTEYPFLVGDCTSALMIGRTTRALGSATQTGTTDLFMARYDANGVLL